MDIISIVKVIKLMKYVYKLSRAHCICVFLQLKHAPIDDLYLHIIVLEFAHVLVTPPSGRRRVRGA